MNLKLITLLLVVTGTIIVGVSNLPESTATQLLSKPSLVAPISYRHDSQLVEVMKRLDLDYSKVNLIYGQYPDYPDAQAYYSGETNTMYLNPVHDYADTDKIVSHEYMHHYQHDNYVEVGSLHPILRRLYSNDTALYERMVSYRDGVNCPVKGCPIAHETFAIACTELADNSLEPKLADVCNRVLPNRTALF